MRRIVCLLIICLSVFGASAQDTYNSSGKVNGYKKKKHKGYDPDRLVLGGGINMGYSGDFLNMGLSPRVGYRLSKVAAAGVGLGYQYVRQPDYILSNNKISYEQYHIVTPSLWGRAKLFNPVFLSTQFEYNIINVRGHEEKIDLLSNQPYLVNSRITVGAPCLLVGAGIQQSIGGRTALTFEIMYDVIQHQYTPYAKQLVYRAGVFVGL